MATSIINSDLVRDSVSTAVANLTRALEPRVNDFAIQTTNRALARSQWFARKVSERIRAQPIYLVYLAAFLLVGAAIFMRSNKSTHPSV